MIQRIQSILLFMVFLLQTSMLIFPISEYVIPGGQIIIFKALGFSSDGVIVESLYQTTLIFIFLCITAVLPLLSLFLYKRRVLQMRLCIYNLILLIGFQAILYWFIWKIGLQFEAITAYKFPFIFPVISAIISYLAFRYIKKDENLIRSLDRIR